MNVQDVPVDGIALEQLDEYLLSDRSPPDCMQLSDLDGFLTAIAIGPEVVMPSEWLSVVWGGDQPGFADEAEARAIIGAIFGRYREILNQIENGTFDPIFWSAKDDVVIASDWAEGFLVGIGLRVEAWEPLLKSKKKGSMLFPILALCGDEDGDSLLEFDRDAENEIMETVTPAIPASVHEIAAYWLPRRKQADGLSVSSFDVRVAKPPKPGRNDPCPCGSGKKFKKCCSD